MPTFHFDATLSAAFAAEGLTQGHAIRRIEEAIAEGTVFCFAPDGTRLQARLRKDGPVVQSGDGLGLDEDDAPPEPAEYAGSVIAAFAVGAPDAVTARAHLDAALEDWRASPGSEWGAVRVMPDTGAEAIRLVGQEIEPAAVAERTIADRYIAEVTWSPVIHGAEDDSSARLDGAYLITLTGEDGALSGDDLAGRLQAILEAETGLDAALYAVDIHDETASERARGAGWLKADLGTFPYRPEPDLAEPSL